MCLIKVNEVFNISKEIVEGVNPITKEPIEVVRTLFSNRAGDIRFYDTVENVDRYLNSYQSEDERALIEECLMNVDRELLDEDVRQALSMLQDSDGIISYPCVGFILSVFMRLNECFECYDDLDELSDLVGIDYAMLLFDLRGKDII